jgi:hypothetical protein
LLRALESVGVFSEDIEGRFRLTPLADGLRSDVPGSLRAYAIMLGEQWLWNAWGGLSYSVETELPAFDQTHGKGVFEYLKENPEASRVFNEAMSSRSRQELPAIIAAYTWPAGTIVDVGAGHGVLLYGILAAQTEARGILFDLPEVIASATIPYPELNARCKKVAGSFFEGVPKEADLYLLKRIIHDWNDSDSVRILENVHSAMHDDSCLLIIEHVLPSDSSPSHGKLLDLQMLVMTSGGRERTETEYATLLSQAGLRLNRIIPTNAGIGLVEAVPM